MSATMNGAVEGEKPHMVIGIDLGMTCTGVAYANLSIGSETIRWVQKWPGRFQANENKVPTVVVYPTIIPNPTPSSWGFLSETVAETTAQDKDYKEWFKTLLSPPHLQKKQQSDPENAPASMGEVEKWYRDYLSKMYEYLAFKLGGELSGVSWEAARVEFIFSVPTTWEPVPTVERFKTIVGEAGFGVHINHIVTIGLTEAEAAAVHVSTEAPGIFRENDILLVCDAGGGTTDLSILRVTGTANQAINLQQLDVVFGETIGSAAIDYEFEKLVCERLERAHAIKPLPIDPADAAWEMMKSRDFQAVKCEYGAPDDTPVFSIGIPKLSHTYDNEEARIRSGEVAFEREDLQRLFDKQVNKLLQLIDMQLQILYRKYPAEQVAHIVLSGGLGNSAYVQTRLRQHYAMTSIPNAHGISVRIAPDPQLAVCKGLVADRVRKLITNYSVLGWRCCRSSYGTMCKIMYDKKNPEHEGKQLVRDPLNGKMYIMQAIAWFVKKGEPVSVDTPIVHNFIKKVTPGDPRRAFPTSVIECKLDAPYLPDQMSPDTHVLCEISSDLSSADEKKFTEKNKRFWSLGKHYFKVEYQVRVLIGPADIRFELWFDNRKLSRDQSITVDWAPAPTMPPAPPVDISTYNRVELPDSFPTHMSGGLADTGGPGNLGVDRTGTGIVDTSGKAKMGKAGKFSGKLGRSWPVYK
ncbi:actin-like ATPase domain-containing protein [Karstenula rhodostoma CBS 690.94]|uniref:Actin-like ATPase domain-containing protein n=1 Tax=Karstenula rhodostoma CBS 690.94 TaxID=1392251 RepID=A0A9P4PQT2_9PLEO|nr:actin-like ATPase domain-containing protein [Karstenula rhodostoma CBS 690.94]